MSKSYDTLLRQITSGFIEDQSKPGGLLEHIKLYDLLGDVKVDAINDAFMDKITLQFQLENQNRARGETLRVPVNMPPYAAAQIVLLTGDVRVLLNDTGKDNRLILRHYYYDPTAGLYKWSGIWIVADDKDHSGIVARLFRRMCTTGTQQDLKLFYSGLFDAQPATVSREAKARFAFFRNGLWDSKDKKFLAYDDPAIDTVLRGVVSLSKLPVNHPLGPGAVLKPPYAEPVFHNADDGTDWTPTSQVEDLFDMTTPIGRASATIIWQTMQFLLYGDNPAPHEYEMWIDGTSGGHNGKGTLWAMMRALIERERRDSDVDMVSDGLAVIPLTIEGLDDDFRLAQHIMTARAIVGEETSGATSYVSAKSCERFKMISRAQSMMFRPIHSRPFSFTPRVIGIQQSNGIPVFAEKGPSVLSHVVIIPFCKVFDDSRAYVKDRYVMRDEVAEWLAYHLTVEVPRWAEYDADALATLAPLRDGVSRRGSSVQRFLHDVLPGLYMDYIPNELSFDLYLRYCEKNGITGASVVSFDDLRRDIEVVGHTPGNSLGVEYCDRPARVKTADMGWSPAFDDYGYSPRLGPSRFLEGGSFSPQKSSEAVGRKLSTTQVAGRIWNRGGLKRLVSWQQVKPDADMTVVAPEDDAD